jgi:hypothetical protein
VEGEGGQDLAIYEEVVARSTNSWVERVWEGVQTAQELGI